MRGFLRNNHRRFGASAHRVPVGIQRCCCGVPKRKLANGETAVELGLLALLGVLAGLTGDVGVSGATLISKCEVAIREFP